MTWLDGSELARGATAVVTRGRPGTVVKTFNGGVPRVVAELEAAGSRAAMGAGLPVPALLEAELDTTPPRLRFAYVPGVSLASRVQVIGAWAVGEVLAEVQHRIRQVTSPALIGPREFHGFQIGEATMPEALCRDALEDLERLMADASTVLCHMDLHDMNVMWDDGPVIIDWNNAMAAPAEADVARTRLLLAHEVFYESGESEAIGELLAGFIARTEALVPGMVARSERWDRVIAAARLDENPPGAEREAILDKWCRGELTID